MYSELDCIVDGLSGSGNVIAKHNFEGLTVASDVLSESTLNIALTYVAPSSDDEMQDILVKSAECTQTVFFGDVSCLEGISWTSLSKDVWTLDTIGYAIHNVFTFCKHLHQLEIWLLFGSC